MNGCINGGFNIKRYDNDESSILNDFSNNIDIVRNGVKTNQNEMLNELYYKNNNYNNINFDKPKKQYIIPEEPKRLEPGQVDPESFFGNSLKGLF